MHEQNTPSGLNSVFFGEAIINVKTIKINCNAFRENSYRTVVFDSNGNEVDYNEFDDETFLAGIITISDKEFGTTLLKKEFVTTENELSNATLKDYLGFIQSDIDHAFGDSTYKLQMKGSYIKNPFSHASKHPNTEYTIIV